MLEVSGEKRNEKKTSIESFSLPPSFSRSLARGQVHSGFLTHFFQVKEQQNASHQSTYRTIKDFSSFGFHTKTGNIFDILLF